MKEGNAQPDIIMMIIITNHAGKEDLKITQSKTNPQINGKFNSNYL